MLQRGFCAPNLFLLAISQCLEIRNELIPKIATGFGAGIGGRGLVCGAISGGIMALGLKFGRNNVNRQKMNPYWFTFQLLERFEKEFGHVLCRELTRCDFTTEAGRKKYEKEKLWETKCRRYVGSATIITFDLITERTSET